MLMDSFIAFNQNALSGLLFVVSSNPWFLLLAASVIVTIVLQLKEEVDESVREEQNII